MEHIKTLDKALETAQALVNSRILPSTRSSYLAKVDVIKKWYNENNKQFNLPLIRDDISSFFGSLVQVPMMGEPSHSPASSSAVRLYKSALVWYYHQEKLQIDPPLDAELENFMHGYQRRVSELKLGGEMELVEGKLPLSFKGYCLLASKFASCQEQSQFNEMTFAWSYLVLQWNLMARVSTIASIKLQHLSWQQDSMIVSIPKHKDDQTGCNSIPRHVYANPLMPAICPVLALAVMVFSYSTFLHENTEQSHNNHNNGSSNTSRRCALYLWIFKKPDSHVSCEMFSVN